VQRHRFAGRLQIGKCFCTVGNHGKRVASGGQE
jgi:hypothetical protein